MNAERRLDRLERMQQPEEPLMRFIIEHPPEGLTPAEEAAWRTRHRAESEAAGIFWFTLDLGAAAVRVGDGEG
ncbi:MAG: hypothetical protein H0W08_06070 [Acidobacteria bacterium]|nr:hypothetical protein [Acidobacteriota bacterium]